MSPGLDLSHRCPCQQWKRRVVVHFAALNQAAVAVTGVFIQAHVADHQQVRQLLLDRPHGPLHDPLRVVGARTDVVFALRDSEEDYGRDAQVVRRLALVHQEINRPAVVSRHGLDFVFNLRSRTNE